MRRLMSEKKGGVRHFMKCEMVAFQRPNWEPTFLSARTSTQTCYTIEHSSIRSLAPRSAPRATKTVHFSESFLGPPLVASSWTRRRFQTRADLIMGRLRSLFICGFNSYQKFDSDQEESGASMNSSASMAYKCNHCGHKQKLKVS